MAHAHVGAHRHTGEGKQIPHSMLSCLSNTGESHCKNVRTVHTEPRVLLGMPASRSSSGQGRCPAEEEGAAWQPALTGEAGAAEEAWYNGQLRAKPAAAGGSETLTLRSLEAWARAPRELVGECSHVPSTQ